MAFFVATKSQRHKEKYFKKILNLRGKNYSVLLLLPLKHEDSVL
jgi:hypothetical protein